MHLEVLFLNESQFFFYFIEVPAGSYFHECFVSVTVFAHAAQELLERGGSEPVKSGLIGFQGNTFQIVNGGYAPIESYAEDLIWGILLSMREPTHTPMDQVTTFTRW